jgi:predicted MFS family arabinose efflux permease
MLAGFARLCSGRVHYAWIVLTIMFLVTLASVGVRAAPGVMIVPLQRALGWDVSTISAAISVNIILFGATGPFIAGLAETFGLKRTILACTFVLIAATGLSLCMTAPWQLFLTWGLMVGIGSGASAVGITAAIANRWFATRTGFAVGVLFAANAAGQLVFLPLLAVLAQRYGWEGVALGVTVAMAAVLPLLMLFLPESPEQLGLAAYGANSTSRPGIRRDNPFATAITTLVTASRSLDFWLLMLSFGICGLSTNGLINTHLIAYCVDNGISEVSAASILAVIGVFSLIGSTVSGWLCDYVNPRVLLFWYYGLRGLSLVALPFTNFDIVSMTIFSVFYGLDWVATGPPTFALANQVFGRRDAPIVVAWIFAGHQVGGALAAFGAGAVRSVTGAYVLAFVASGLACLLASLLVLRITHAAADVSLAK